MVLLRATTFFLAGLTVSTPGFAAAQPAIANPDEAARVANGQDLVSPLLSEEEATLRMQALLSEANEIVAADLEAVMARDILGDGWDDNPVTAAQRYREALEIGRQNLGDAHPMTARAMYQLASFYSQFDRAEQARALILELVEIDSRTEATSHSDSIYLSKLLRRVGEHELAERYLRRGLDLSAQQFGRENCGDIIVLLAEFLISRGRFEEAEPLLMEAQDIFAERYLEDTDSEVVSIPARSLFFITDKNRAFEDYPVAFPPSGDWHASLSLSRSFVEWKVQQIQRFQLPLVRALRFDPLTPETLLDSGDQLITGQTGQRNR